MKKRLLRLCSIVLIISMVLGNVVSLAADDTTSTGTESTETTGVTTGMTFSPTLKGVIDKPFESSIKTVEATICLPKTLPEGVNNYQGVILGMYGANSVPALCFEISSGGYPNVYYYKEGSGVPTRVLFNQALNTGLVTNLAFVLNDSEEGTVVSCYVNGKEVEVHSTSAQLGRTFEDPTIAYCVGGDYRTDATGSYFKGEIHSLAVYSEARTADEIASDVTNGVTTSDEGLMTYYDLTTVDDSTTEVNNGATVTQGTYDLTLVETWMDTRRPALDEENIAYSIALVGDTQIATEYDVYYEEDETKEKVVAGIYDWLLENKEEKNIEFVIGLGDIVQGESTYSFNKALAKESTVIDKEWEYAMEQIHTLDGEIPYSLIRGNHDSQEKYNQYVTQAGHGNVIDGALDGTMLNTWQELVVGDIKYLIMSLDLGASDTELAWAEEVIKTHPNHNVIISTHAYLNDDGTTLDENDGEFAPANYYSTAYPEATHNRNNGDEMWDNYFTKYDNVVMIVSGHIGSDDIIMTQATGDNGNKVAQMLVDPQSLDNDLVKAGDTPTGMICLLNFSADGKNVQVEQYSTANGQWYMSTSQMSFEMNVIEDANQRLLLNEELMTVRPSYVSASSGETVYRAFGQHVQNCAVNANQIILAKDNTAVISYTAPSNGMLKITDMTLAFHNRTDAGASGREFEFAVVDEEGKILSNRGNILTINADNKIASGMSIETQKLTQGESIYFVFHSNLMGTSSNVIDCIPVMEFSVDGGVTWTQVNTTHSSYYVPWPNDITTYPLKTGYPEVEQGMGGFYYHYSDVYEVVSYQEPEYVYVDAKEMHDGRSERADFPFIHVKNQCMTNYNQIIASAGYTNIIAYEAPEKGKIRIDEMQVWIGNYAPQTTDRGFAFAVIDSEGKVLSNNGQVYMSNTIYTSETNATSTAGNIKVPTQNVEAGDRIYFVFHGNAGGTTCIKCNAKILFCKDGESTWTQVNAGSEAQSMTLYSANNYINSSSTVVPTQGEGNFYYMYSEPNTTDKDGVRVGDATEGIVTIYEAPKKAESYHDKYITEVATDGTVSYVDLDMLNVKIQSKVHKETSEETGEEVTTNLTDVRFIASVDNLSYQKAGFLFTKDATIANDSASFVVGKIPDKANRDTTKVYTMLLANGIYRRATDIYANDGCNTAYAYAFEMTGIPAKEGTIYVRAYVLLENGNYVYGEPRAIDVTAAGTVN